MVNNLPRLANIVSTKLGRFLREFLILFRNHIPSQALVLALSLVLSLVRCFLRSVSQSRVRVGHCLFELGLTLHLSLGERLGSRAANLAGVLGVSALGEDDFRVLADLASKCRKRRFQIDFTHSFGLVL